MKITPFLHVLNPSVEPTAKTAAVRDQRERPPPPESIGLPQQGKVDALSKDLGEALQKLEHEANETFALLGHTLRFRRHESGRVVMQVIDDESGDLVREIPDEDSLALAERIDEMRGLLFSSEG